jgi:GPH family glycoside/pentoside/hexuronide:cation symporter
MSASTTNSKPRISSWRMLSYAIGEGVTSITLGGISNFALLYYTSVLGLGAGMAGLALSLSLFLDAFMDPVMGHISDNTRSRWGRRLPYILVGGLLLAPAFFWIWILPVGVWPAGFLFLLAFLANLLLRIALTVFGIPFLAMGFELCQGYEDRSRLQGIRNAFNMLINLMFGGCAWLLFFHDGTSANGVRVDGTAIPGNYVTMATVLSLTVLVLVVLCVWLNRDLALDNRGAQLEGNSLRSFWMDLTQILSDRLAWYVFAFFSVALFGMLFVSQLQMLVYVFFMQFRPEEKTFIHGGGMIAAGLGALFQGRVTHWFDKKAAGYAGIVIGAIGGLLLFFVFTCMGFEPRAIASWSGFSIPVGLLLFGLGQWLYWFGAGMLGPISFSMVADLSEIHYLKSGIRKDGGYSSVFSLLQKAALSLGLLLSGWLIAGTGIVSGAEIQAPEAVSRIAVLTFVIGPVLMVAAFFILRKYPVTRESLRAMEQKSGAHK